MRKALEKAGMITAVAVLILGLFALDIKIWQLQHPNAPTWTYFLSGRRK